MPDIPKLKREKKWSQLYHRSNKLARAEQLGIDYPRVTEAQLMARSAAEATAESAVPARQTPIKVLFICSRNQWRSPTAENIWRRHPQVAARSAGTSPNARHPVSEDDLRWADVIFVMEEKHKSRLVASFRRVIEAKPLHVLDIPDDYKYMDPALVEELQSSVAGILGL